jgi:hypothetical protein
MTFQVAAGSPWWLVAAANLILFLHIAGGTVGILSGASALLARKGGCLHRVAGTVFLVSMLTMATIGAAASPFLPVPSMPNVFAGILTFYLEVLRMAIGRAFKLLVMGSAADWALGCWPHGCSRLSCIRPRRVIRSSWPEWCSPCSCSGFWRRGSRQGAPCRSIR